jgi:hypothetical protein
MMQLLLQECKKAFHLTGSPSSQKQNVMLEKGMLENGNFIVHGVGLHHCGVLCKHRMGITLERAAKWLFCDNF